MLHVVGHEFMCQSKSTKQEYLIVMWLCFWAGADCYSRLFTDVLGPRASVCNGCPLIL